VPDVRGRCAGVWAAIGGEQVTAHLGGGEIVFLAVDEKDREVEIFQRATGKSQGRVCGPSLW